MVACQISLCYQNFNKKTRSDLIFVAIDFSPSHSLPLVIFSFQSIE